MDYTKLIKTINDCAYQVRLDFAAGYLESVYQNALLILLLEAGLRAEKEKVLTIEYHGQIIGEFRADILVENNIIIELKAVSNLQQIHEIQLVNYLNVTGLDIGLLINYGSQNFEIKKKFRTMDLLNRYRLGQL